MGENHGPDPARRSLDLSALSAREREVLDAALEGVSARDIAERLSISEATVRSHLATIYAKVGVSGRVELLARLHQHAVPASARPPDARPPLRERVRPPLVRNRWWLLIGAGLVLLLAAFLVTRPDLPPRSDLAAVGRLLDEGTVRSLDLRGQTLTVVETNGDRLRVEGVSETAVEPIARRAIGQRIGMVMERGTGNVMAQLLTALAPLVLGSVALLLLVILVVRVVRAPPTTSS